MKRSKKDPDAKYRKLLEPMADHFVRATPQARRQAVAGMLPHSEPKPLRLLAELLIARLDDEDAGVREGSADTLALLGPHVLPAINCALVVRPTGRRLLHLARVVEAIGPKLSEQGRRGLLEMLLIAERLSPTAECHAAVWAAMGSLHEAEFEEHRDEYEAQRRKDEEDAAGLIARYEAAGRKGWARRGQSTSPASEGNSARSAS
jgi:hypothetical protein